MERLAQAEACGSGGRAPRSRLCYNPGNIMKLAQVSIPSMLDGLVRRIIAAVHPVRIILFGSAARGEMGPHSDLDVLVVLPTGTEIRRAEEAIYRALWGFGLGTDIVAVTEEDIQRHGSNRYLVIHTALTQGKELYRAAG